MAKKPTKTGHGQNDCGIKDCKGGCENDPKSKHYKGEYAFARDSKFSNVGEDLANSKRHKFHEYQNLAEAEAKGEGRKFASREKYLEIKEVNFLDGINEENALGKLAFYFLAKKFPPAPNYKEIGRGESEEAFRKEYLYYYDWLLSQKDSVLYKQDLNYLGSKLLLKINERNEFGIYSPVREQIKSFYSNCLYRTWKDSSIVQQLSSFEKLEPQERLEKVKALISSGKLSDETKEKSDKPKVSSYYGEAIIRQGKELPLKTYEEQTNFLNKEVGLKGLQWGNYVSDKERAEHAKHLYEAFNDLSEVLDVPVNKLSMSGNLGVSIGARGSGTARAHYEAGSKVINIAKEGSGALAHEYMHGLDNFLAEKLKSPVFGKSRATSGGQYITNAFKEFKDKTPQLAEVNEKVKSFQSSLNKFRSRISDEMNKMGNSKGNFDYYCNDQQELFARVGERIIQKKLERKGCKNTYLSGSEGDNVYPNDEELKEIEPHFDNLLKEIKKHW